MEGYVTRKYEMELRERLYGAIKEKIGERNMTLDAVIRCIKDGVGEEDTLALQQIAKASVEGKIYVAGAVGNEVLRALVKYTPRAKEVL